MNSALDFEQEDTFVTNFITYGFAISMSYTVFAPIERIKIILQTHRLSNISRSDIFTRPSQVFNQVRKRQGILSFWNGNATYVLKESINIALRYGISHIFARATINNINETRFSVSLKKYLAIFVSSFCTLSMTYPLEIIRLRLIKDMSGKDDVKVFKGFGDCFKKLIVKEGFQSLFKGYFFSSLLIIPYLGVSFGIYENLKAYEVINNDLTVLILSISLGQLLFYPLDTVRKRIQINGGIDHLKLYTGAKDCFYSIKKTEGVKGFYAGFLINLLRLMPQAAFQLLMYEQAFKFLEEIKKDNRNMI